MKTVITVTNTVQWSMDEYRDVKTSKTFTDESTIGEIKDWMIKAGKIKNVREKVGLSGTEISDLEE
jgi:hypothetical protein